MTLDPADLPDESQRLKLLQLVKEGKLSADEAFSLINGTATVATVK